MEAFISMLMHPISDSDSTRSKQDTMADEFDETELVIDSPDQEPMEDEDLPEPDLLDLNTHNERVSKDKDANREQVSRLICLIGSRI